MISEGVQLLEASKNRLCSDLSLMLTSATMLRPASRTQDHCSAQVPLLHYSRNSNTTDHNRKNASLRHCRYSRREGPLSQMTTVRSVDSHSTSGVQILWRNMGCWTFVGSAMSMAAITNCRSAAKRVAADTYDNTAVLQA